MFRVLQTRVSSDAAGVTNTTEVATRGPPAWGVTILRFQAVLTVCPWQGANDRRSAVLNSKHETVVSRDADKKSVVPWFAWRIGLTAVRVTAGSLERRSPRRPHAKLPAASGPTSQEGTVDVHRIEHWSTSPTPLLQVDEASNEVSSVDSMDSNNKDDLECPIVNVAPTAAPATPVTPPNQPLALLPPTLR